MLRILKKIANCFTGLETVWLVRNLDTGDVFGVYADKESAETAKEGLIKATNATQRWEADQWLVRKLK